MIRILCLALCASFVAMASAGPIEIEVEVRAWDHGAWNLRTYAAPGRPGLAGCEVWTGGAGAGVFSIHMGNGGADASVSYVPVTVRGLPTPLTPDDTVLLIVDGRPLALPEELDVFAFENASGEWEVSADAGNLAVADTVRALRAGTMMQVGVTHANSLAIHEDYPLTGFTATWLKAADWCGFDPGKTFRTL